MTAESLREAVSYYRRAIELDPSYALAYAGVADAHNMLAIWDFLPHNKAFPEARVAALKALEIDPLLAEAHAALAYTKFRHDWEWQTAEQEFKRAIELNPNYTAAHQLYAEYLIVAQRFDEALNELNRSCELDPLSLYVRFQAAVRLYFMRQHGEAIEQLREVVRMDSNYTIAYGLMWACYREKGMPEEAVAAQLQSLRLNGCTERVELHASGLRHIGHQGVRAKRD